MLPTDLPTDLPTVEQWHAFRADYLRLREENVHLRAELAVAQAQIADLQTALADTCAALQQLQEQQRQLQQELTTIKQQPFTSRRRRASQRETIEAHPRGRPPGHEGSSRAKPTRIDRTEALPAPDSCPDCDTSFSGQGVVRERLIEDLNLVRPTIVTRYLIERRWCPKCRTYRESPVTAALPNHRFGLHVLLFVVYQKVALGLSYAKIQHELRTYFGLTISVGELPSMVEEVARLFGPAYARLIVLMRRQAAIHIDETSWRIDGSVHWLWVFVNDVVALYVVSRSRGSKVPQALLGADFDGVAISDFFSAYSPLDVEKAKCWSHLLRDSHELAKGKPPDSERGQFHRRLHSLFLEMGLALEEVAADPAGRRRVHHEMRSRLAAFAACGWRDWECRRLAERISKYLDELLVWLVNPAVPADNNVAERALRPAVVTRKTSFGSRSKAGAQAFARLLSLIETWERQGLDFFATAHTALAEGCSQS
jgi:transposase